MVTFLRVYQRAFVGSQIRGGGFNDSHLRVRVNFGYFRSVVESLFIDGRRHLVCVKMAIWHHACVVLSGFLMLLVRSFEKNANLSFPGQWPMGKSTLLGLTAGHGIFEEKGGKFDSLSPNRDVGSL